MSRAVLNGLPGILTGRGCDTLVFGNHPQLRQPQDPHGAAAPPPLVRMGSKRRRCICTPFPGALLTEPSSLKAKKQVGARVGPWCSPTTALDCEAWRLAEARAQALVACSRGRLAALQLLH